MNCPAKWDQAYSLTWDKIWRPQPSWHCRAPYGRHNHRSPCHWSGGSTWIPRPPYPWQWPLRWNRSRPHWWCHEAVPVSSVCLSDILWASPSMRAFHLLLSVEKKNLNFTVLIYWMHGKLINDIFFWYIVKLWLEKDYKFAIFF